MKKCKDVKIYKAMIDFIIGDCGSGKSVLACKIGKSYQKKGYPVYSNMYIEGFRKFELSDLMRYDFEEGAVIILDEAPTFGLASRGDNYKKNNTQNVIEFFTTYRHYNVERIIIIAPSFQDVIPVVRSRIKSITVVRSSLLLNLLFLPCNITLALLNKPLQKFSSCKYVIKKIDIVDNGGAEPREVYAWKPLFYKFFWQNPFYKYYDSFSKRILDQKKWEYWK